MKSLFFKFMPVVLMLVYIAFIGWVFLAPQYEKLNWVNQQKASLEKQLASAKRNASTLNEWRVRMKDHEKEFQLIAKALPDEPNLIGLMSAFAREAADRGIIFSSFESGKPRSLDFYIASPVRANFTGPLNELVALINASGDFIETFSYRRLTLEKSGAGDIYRLESDLEAYHFR